MVSELSDDLRDNYKIDRQRPHGEEWPPDQPSSIVNLALIHYKNTRTQQELIEISKRCKEGAFHVDSLTASHSSVTTDIHKVFVPKGDSAAPRRILIEGAPGIGKTVLAKEIAYQWANGEILKEYKLVFFLYLRDPKSHEVKSVNEILELFTSKNTPDLQKYVNVARGVNVAFVFDGFDEYPVALQKDSYIKDLIKGVNDGKRFFNSTVVVTSRPTATLFLHSIVDRRIEILGFPKEERDKYISLSIGDSLDRKQELDKYLNQHPIIDNLCYVPLHLAILMYLFQQDSLPETLTEMNESFIINTIYRYLERNELSPPSVVKKLEDLPIKIFIYKLSQLAFKGLQDNQLVFTLDEIRETCPEVDNLPGAINAFGLLQAVQHYPKRGAGRTTSINFLHFTMQEYLAALHVSRLPNKLQLSLMRNTFWDGRFNFMWMMYVGIVGVKSNTFMSFIASDSSNFYSNYQYNEMGMDHSHPFLNHSISIYNDKRKCLQLFQCYMEAKSDAGMPEKISSIFTCGKIVLSNITLLPHHITSLVFFMSASSMKQWRILEMDNCNLRDIGMNSLLKHVIKNDENISTLEYVDLSGNDSSPWGVYCAIIRHCCVNSLTLCGDQNMEEYTKELTDSLQTNETLQSLTLYKIGQIGVQLIQDVLGNNTTIKELNMSWKSKVHRKLTHNKFNSNSQHEVVVDINILYDGDHESSPEAVNMSNKDINDDASCLISFGLCNNTIVKKLDLSHNSISVNGMKWLSQCLKHAMSLEYVDLSKNMSSPWGVYCAIIRHCCVNNLTLCGDKGMKEYTKEITDSLQANVMLQSLTLCKIGQIGFQSIQDVLGNNATLKELNMSWRSKGRKIIHRKLTHNEFNSTRLDSNSHEGVVDINILYDGDHECSSEVINMSNEGISYDEVCLIAFGLYNNTTLKNLDLSCNNINVNGMKRLSECIKYMPLEYVDLSRNIITPWGVYCAIIKHCCVNSLTLCGDKGMKEYTKEITDSLQANVMLQSLTLCKIGQIGLQSIQDVLGNNATLKELNMSWKGKGRKIIHRKVPHNEFNSTRLDSNSHEGAVDINILYDGDHECSSEVINMSNEGISYDEVYLIAFGLYNNIKVKRLDLSCNNISVNGMKRLSECFKLMVPLEYVDLSENYSSPWGVYCAIIRHCCVNSLTLCGDKGMKDYVKEIIDILKINTMLQSLTLFNIGRIGLESIKDVLENTTTLKELNLSWKRKILRRKLIHNSTKFVLNSHEVADINILYDDDDECSSEVIDMSNKDINDDAVYLITFGLCSDTTVQKLDLSCNKITDDGAVPISDCLKSNCSLQTLILSRNSISYKGAKKISEIIHVNKVIQKLDMSHNNICDDGAATISECLKTNNTLQELNLSDNWITDEGAKKIAEAIHVNKGLHKLYIAHNAIRDNGVMYISNSLKHNDTLLELNLSKNGISDEGRKIIVEAIQFNVSLQELDLSHNYISDGGMIVILKNRRLKRKRTDD